MNHNKTDPKSTKVDIIRVELDGIAVNLEYKSTCLSSQAQIQKSLFLQHHETWLYKSLISGGATSAMGKCFPKLPRTLLPNIGAISQIQLLSTVNMAVPKGENCAVSLYCTAVFKT